jgi:hypothetical protein
MSTTDGKLACLGLNSPTSRRARERQQSTFVTSVATHAIHGRRSSEHDAVQIPWHIWFPTTFHLHLKLDLMMMCTQAYDTTRAGKATVKVRDIHGHPRESHGRRSRADGVDHLILCHIWGTSIRGCIVVLLRCHFCVVFWSALICIPHVTIILEINISILLLQCFFLLHCHVGLPPLRVGRCHTNAKSLYETAMEAVTPP